MIQTVKAQNIDLRYLIDNFGIQRIRDHQFFWEWQVDFPELTEIEKQELDRVQEGYFNLVEYQPLLENVVKLTIISPILFIAGLYLSPFHIKAEKSIDIRAEDEGIIIEGRIDILILKQNLWVTVIEAKQTSFSLEEGLAQSLTYMLGEPNSETPTFGMITNGVNFRFVKLIREEILKYALSDEFVIDNRGNELYSVLMILKYLSQLAG
ncbi:type I restriction endonuclease [Limnofasciculus baicalensis]|uniref:Type I restriction endonuclease n=1 Tax=Limnofasciculus baicalensis BBK-W-15 TaxID=2699891 RepID=A0AAE3GZ72_9CYAN|nr:type I restriction endonuclease [Limnofasciculus baicalensis]MCP2731302.1 type I restriction endonuclease [Limnofasciculus baicalensis BBK-W-15]